MRVWNLEDKTIVTYLILLLVGLLPFWVCLDLVIPHSSYSKELICIAIVGYVFKRGRINLNFASIGMLIYVCAVFILLFTSKEKFVPANAFNLFRYRCMYAFTLGLAFSAYNFTTTELRDFTKRLVNVMYWSGLIVALIGVYEMYNPARVHAWYGDSLTTHLSLRLDGGISNRLVSTMGNPIALGFQMTLTIISALYLLSEDNIAKFKKLFYSGTIILFFTVLVFTFSRIALVAALFALITFVFIQININKGQILRQLTMLLLVGLVFIGIAFYLNSQGDLAARFTRMNVSTYTENSRFKLATEFLNKMELTPFTICFGTGISGDRGALLFELGYASVFYESGVLGLGLLGILWWKSIVVALTMVGKANRTTGFFLYVLGTFALAMLSNDAYSCLPFSLWFWLSVFSVHNARKCIVLEP